MANAPPTREHQDVPPPECRIPGWTRYPVLGDKLLFAGRSFAAEDAGQAEQVAEVVPCAVIVDLVDAEVGFEEGNHEHNGRDKTLPDAQPKPRHRIAFVRNAFIGIRSRRAARQYNQHEAHSQRAKDRGFHGLAPLGRIRSRTQERLSGRKRSKAGGANWSGPVCFVQSSAGHPTFPVFVHFAKGFRSLICESVYCHRQISLPSGSKKEPRIPFSLRSAELVTTPLARSSRSAASTSSTRRHRRALPGCADFAASDDGTISNSTPSISKRATKSCDFSCNPNTSR